MDSFLGDLFDFTFTRFITTKWIKFIYLVALSLLALFLLIAFLAGIAQLFNGDGAMQKLAGILFIGFAIIFFLIYVIVLRITLEIVAVFFRIEEHTRWIARASGAPDHGAPAGFPVSPMPVATPPASSGPMA
jgi:hypothetical protein